ncbi:Inosose isomerase [Pigmentiphaga humi]|uniref:Inosose isomerase n=1 Tax=Pigmentiphaga humi TaxID=2478468 RepID=A0A3P4B2V6_9BURK|nr:sugar phosphate isomerase/epimerase family protein [Pigmentiphaga humi]VCU70040.1 Inosose isomerase [Pigmentiphaga humi]
MITRRTMLLASLLPTLPGAAGAKTSPAETGAVARSRLGLCMHQTTSAKAGFQASMEGWSRAGIEYVELTAKSLDDFLKNNTLQAAGRLLGDLNLTAVSCTPGLTEIWNPHPGRKAALEVWERRCQQFAELGLKRIYGSANTKSKMTLDDYKAGPACMREAADIAQKYGMTAMIEFSRSSTYISTLPTLLKLIREADHSHLKPVFDFYHFFTGLSKTEDLDMLKNGEIGHVHFQDVPDLPRELLDGNSRAVPGEGIAPLQSTLKKLLDKGYSGPLSVELYLPELQGGDPFETARRIRAHAEPVMRSAESL